MTSQAHSQKDDHSPVVCYVTAGEDSAEEGAMALERVAAGPDRTVVATPTLGALEEAGADSDCVVFDGDPNAHSEFLASVLDAVGTVPVVVFADGPYVPGEIPPVAGYVRKDVGGAHHHLANQVSRLAASTERGQLGDGAATAVFEHADAIAACRERDSVFETLVTTADEVLEAPYTWFATINFGDLETRASSPAVPDAAVESISLEDPLAISFRAREAIRIDDVTLVEWIDPPFEAARSVYTVPVSDLGVLYVASEEPEAFDEPTLSLIDALCAYATTILERTWDEQGLANQRDRLERERAAVFAERDRIADERDAVLALFRTVGDPTLRFAHRDGEAVVTGVDPAFETAFDIDGDDLIGEPVPAVAIPDGLVSQREQLAAALADRSQHSFECPLPTPDGVRTYELTVLPADVDAGGDGGTLLLRDVTDHAQRDRRLSSATRRLERLEAALGEDLREPVTDATGYLELAEKTGKADHFEVVEQALARLERQLDALTAAAAGETEPVPLTSVVTDRWLTLETGDAELVVDDELVVEADADELADLAEYVLEAVLESETADTWGDDEEPPVTVTVGAIEDGFYVAGNRPADEEGDAEPDRLAAAAADGIQFDLVERIADAHGWDVGIAEDDEGTAFAFRGVTVHEAD